MKFIAISLFIALFLYYPIQSIKAQNVGVNTTTPEAALDVNGDIIIRPSELIAIDGITVALDVNSTRFSYYRITGPTADFIIAGITAGIDGRLVTLFNRSGFTMQLNNEDPTAATVDMVATGTNSDITIPNKGIVNLQYDGVEQKWVVRSSSKGPVPGGGGHWDINGNDIFNSNTGNVGIGTNSPTSPLTIQTDLNSNGWTHVGGNGSVVVGETIGGVSAAIGTSTEHILRLNAGSLGRIQIIPDGNVVVGDQNVAPYGRLTVRTANNSYGMIHTSNEGNVIGTFIGGTSAGIGTYSNTNMRIFSNNTSVMFIAAATGNVGVGADDNPLFKMDIGNRIRIRSGSGGSTAGVWLNNTINTAPIAFMGIADDFTTGFYGNVSGWGLIMNTNTGNVGIGTLNPTYKLSVNGDIRTKEVVVETGWADYVFDKKYKLIPLAEVEDYIRQNKHLPGIPSAKEVNEKGLHVGDIQKKMMEKIEELTLYIIELKKEVSALKSASHENE
jgi:hypothetical protein